MKKNHGILILVLLAVMWGLSWPINKVGLHYLGAASFVAWRFLFGSVAMLIVAFWKKQLVLPGKKDLPIIVMQGIFQMALMMTLSNYGLSKVGAGSATFLVFTTSIWLIPLNFFIDRWMSWRLVFSFLFGITGILLLCVSAFTEQHATVLAILALVFGAISWSIGILSARHMEWKSPVLQLYPWQLLLATVLCFTNALLWGEPLLPEKIDLFFISTLLYTGTLSIGFGYWGLISIKNILSPAVISLGLVCVPIISMVTSVFFLQEPISFELIFAVALITVGVLLHIRAEKKRPIITEL